MYTSPTIDTSSILARQQETLQTNSQNIVQKSSGGSLTFLDKLSNFIDKAAPVVYKVQDVAHQVQTRVPGTNIVYNPQLKASAPKQSNSNNNAMVAVGLTILTGIVIYATTRNSSPKKSTK